MWSIITEIANANLTASGADDKKIPFRPYRRDKKPTFLMTVTLTVWDNLWRFSHVLLKDLQKLFKDPPLDSTEEYSLWSELASIFVKAGTNANHMSSFHCGLPFLGFKERSFHIPEERLAGRALGVVERLQRCLAHLAAVGSPGKTARAITQATTDTFPTAKAIVEEAISSSPHTAPGLPAGWPDPEIPKILVIDSKRPMWRPRDPEAASWYAPAEPCFETEPAPRRRKRRREEEEDEEAEHPLLDVDEVLPHEEDDPLVWNGLMDDMP